MASTFDRWEKDPFFSAAEEVQESADRMESTYRTWIHAIKDTSGSWNLDELRTGLQITLGTTKWQLEEFGCAVKSSYPGSNSIEDAKDRHQDFIVAIENQITKVESSLNESTASQGKPPLPWVRLDEGERNELAMFLSGSSSSSCKTSGNVNGKDQRAINSDDAYRQATNECSRSSSHLVELGQVEGKEEKILGHRRTASASPEISSWKIMVYDEALPHDSSTMKSDLPPRKIPSFSGLLNTVELSMSQLKWPNNGYKKLNLTDQHQDAFSTVPGAQNLTKVVDLQTTVVLLYAYKFVTGITLTKIILTIKGMNICYEKNKSCLWGCDDCYNKHLYGWTGAIQRQLQRSQYQIQYSRPVQVVFSVALVYLLVFVALTAIGRGASFIHFCSAVHARYKNQRVTRLLWHNPT